MNQKVYFAGSIRGGQDDIQLYHDMIAYIKKTRKNRFNFTGYEKY